jgi:hypothetical protein
MAAKIEHGSATRMSVDPNLDSSYWSPLVPELTVTNVDASLRFYTAVGFTVRFRREEPPFAYIELGRAQLMLEQQHSTGWNVEPLDRPLGRGVNFQVEVADVDAMHSSLTALGTSMFRGVCNTWYPVSATLEEGQREFLAQDPDGYLLRFSQYLGQRDVT